MKLLNKRSKRLVKQFVKADQQRCRINLVMVFEAIMYVVKTGCQWALLPKYYPSYTSVYYHFRVWNERGVLPKLLKKLVQSQRRKLKKNPNPTVAVIDSQSVRTGHDTSIKGVDGYKKGKGIKRQIAVDSNGYPLAIEITTANVNDSKGAKELLENLREEYSSISLIKADKGYQGTTSSIAFECIKSNFGTSEFLPIAGRWVVERSFAWLEKYRRLMRNYEQYLFTAKAMTYFAAVSFMLRYV